MSITGDYQTLDYTSEWKDYKYLNDNFEDFLYEDHRTSDRNGYIIQLPAFNEIPKGSIENWLGKNIQGYSTPNDTTLLYGSLDSDAQWELYQKKRKEYLNLTGKDSPIKAMNKNAGKLVAYGWDNDKNEYIQIGAPTTDVTVANSRIDKQHKIRKKVKFDINGDGVEETFDNDEHLEKELKKLETEGLKKLYGDLYPTYNKFHDKDNIFDDNLYGNAIKASKTYMDNYFQKTHPSNDKYATQVDVPEKQQAQIEQFTQYKIIELVQYPERLEELINYTFGTPENTTPFNGKYPVAVHHPVKIEILEDVVRHMKKFGKGTNPNVDKMIQVAERFIKASKNTTNIKIANAIEATNKENSNESGIERAFNFLVKDLVPTVLSAEYKGDDRKAGNKVWYGTINVIEELTTRKSSDGKRIRNPHYVNGRPANSVRQAIDVNQEWLRNVINNQYAYKNLSGYITMRDKIMYPLMEDLISEYKHEHNISGMYKPQDLMLWLYRHPDKRYSEDKDNDFYSYYEVLKTGWYSLKDEINDEAFNRIMKTDVDELGTYSTIQTAYEQFEKYKRNRVHFSSRDGSTNYHAPDLYKQLVVQDPHLLISYLQASKKNRGDSFHPRTSAFPTMLNEYTEGFVIGILEDAFGKINPNDGDYYDWLNMSPSEFPGFDDVRDEWREDNMDLYTNQWIYKMVMPEDIKIKLTR